MHPEPFKKWTRPTRLRWRLRRHLPADLGPSRLKLVAGGGPWNLVEIARRDRDLVLRIAGRNEIADDGIHFSYRVFLPVIVYLFSRTATSVRRAVAELSDGSPQASDHILFSGSAADAILVPDPEFFNTRGYMSLRERLREQRPWRERSDTIVWRGSTTGSGRALDETLDWEAPDVLQRIRMCGILGALPNVDAKIHRVVQMPNPEDVLERLRRAQLLGSYVAEFKWLDQRFAIDIDGNTNAWSNLFTRLLCGCCVIKIASPNQFRQWYYDGMVPWKHFVPVQADLTDLVERVEWCQSHLTECCQIAAAGQKLALSMTFDSETHYAIGRINQRLR